jgi:peroxiredoxin
MTRALLIALSLSIAAGAETVSVGAKAPEFTLKTFDGKEVSLKKVLAEEKTKAVAVVFWAKECPAIKASDPVTIKIHEEFKGQGVVFLGIDSDKVETKDAEGVLKHVAEHGVYPILNDTGNVIADEFGAVTTPHVFLIDKGGKVVYRGAPYAKAKDDPPALKAAIQELLAGKEITLKETKPFG